MDTKILQLAIEQLSREVELLKEQNKQVRQEIEALKTLRAVPELKRESTEGELLDTKQVLSYLGICYNTLQSIIKKGLLTPIRINQRRIRFRKDSILNYISCQRN
jgi:hypothetical protein